MNKRKVLVFGVDVMVVKIRDKKEEEKRLLGRVADGLDGVIRNEWDC